MSLVADGIPIALLEFFKLSLSGRCAACHLRSACAFGLRADAFGPISDHTTNKTTRDSKDSSTTIPPPSGIKTTVAKAKQRRLEEKQLCRECSVELRKLQVVIPCLVAL